MADFVARFYGLHAQGVADTRDDLPSTPPPAVAARLAPLPLTWSSLPTLARRALLWDTGFVRSTAAASSLVSVQTQCVNGSVGLSMSSIGVNTYDGATVGCNSSQAAATYWRQASSAVVNMNAKCAIDAPLANGGSVLWSQDDLGQLTVPSLQVFMVHAGSWSLYAIESSPWPAASASKCPPTNRPSGVVVPCFSIDNTTARGSSHLWCDPAPSPLMDSWLAHLADPTVPIKTPPPATSPAVTHVPTARPSDTIVVPKTATTGTTGTLVIVFGVAFGVTAVIVGVCFIAWFQRRLHEMIERTELRSMALANRPRSTDEEEKQEEGDGYSALVTPKGA
ncbi:hypothetical protein ACHHYP_02753 [Achlya hypogyna]|uniref:Uncharacterized protein n=1 Tax=Achlya hypogyna TaxID=1202772 RepID=A0A1V9Z5S7_ACHHY|nr:hypothetical protein ACHHYP_02753 [Achlya hypogyna]